ncbi:MAG TPA: hypothetical protein VNH19_03230 [Candidatus Limnocylindrales bacterium]|nr:hypothetical protein [Candidatus Limnocylindrales bacterium]
MTDLRKLVSKKIVIMAALFSIMGSGAYACTYFSGTSQTIYTLFLRISYIGMPGILAAVVLSIGLLGSHGGGPLGMLLVIATPINFLLYVALGLTARKLADLFRKHEGKTLRNQGHD